MQGAKGGGCVGWTVTHKPKGQTLKEFFTEEFGEGVLDVAQVGFTEAYVAYKCRDGRVIAIACHTRYYNDPYFNFGYKDVSEDMGPYICNCPERILKQLSPTDNNWAKEWRKRCWESIRRKKKSSLIRDGDFIKFREPISFQGGETLNLFKVEKSGRRVLFKRAYYSLSLDDLLVYDLCYYRITKWQMREYEILSEDEAKKVAKREAEEISRQYKPA